MDVRVFLVEGLGHTRNALMQWIESIDGLRVVGCASTEAEARFWLDENRGGWDLAVVGLMLEQGSTKGVLACCGAQPEKGRLVVFSSGASPAVRDRCMQLGADAVFDKPDKRALMAFCQDLLERENPGS
jgi:DNA-binding NarL/FixJ family response regulator